MKLPRSTSWTIKSRWIFPVDRPPLANGTLTISGEHVVAVQACGEAVADDDLGNVAIIPGLVNAHTHLDLSRLRGKTPPVADFTQWLSAVIGQRREQTLEQT